MGLLSFIKESIQEGFDEAKEEQRRDVDKYQKIKSEPVDLEKAAVAMACPFREIMISSDLGGFSPHLYKLGMLNDKEREDAKKYLKRDFGISGADDFFRYKEEYMEGENEPEADDPLRVAVASIGLYILTTEIDADYITWEEALPNITVLVEAIVKESDTHSWEEFAKRVMAGEKKLGINNGLGRKLIQNRVEWLLTNEESPWVSISWNELRNTLAVS